MAIRRRDGVLLPDWLAPGRTFLISRAASPQFRGVFPFRVIRVDDLPSYEGWAWLKGYVLDPDTGLAVTEREIFVRLAGLRPAQSPRRAQSRPAQQAQSRPAQRAQPPPAAADSR